MAWTEEQWYAARAAYEHARAAAQGSATALNSLSEAARTRVAVAAGPSGQAAVNAAQALAAEFPEEETRANEARAKRLVRNAITFANRFVAVDTRLHGAAQRGEPISEADWGNLLNAGWHQARADIAAVQWREVAQLPGIRPAAEPRTLTSQSDPQPSSSTDEPSSSTDDEPSSAPGSQAARNVARSSTETRARRRRRRSIFRGINPWPIAIAIGLWLYGRR